MQKVSVYTKWYCSDLKYSELLRGNISTRDVKLHSYMTTPTYLSACPSLSLSSPYINKIISTIF